MYFNLSAFAPLFIEERFEGKISNKMVGLMVAAMELAGVLSSPIHGLSISKMGRKNAWILGYLTVIVGTFMLGATSYYEKKDWKLFYTISVLGRFLQGYGDSICLTVIFAQIP